MKSNQEEMKRKKKTEKNENDLMTLIAIVTSCSLCGLRCYFVAYSKVSKHQNDQQFGTEANTIKTIFILSCGKRRTKNECAVNLENKNENNNSTDENI